MPGNNISMPNTTNNNNSPSDQVLLALSLQQLQPTMIPNALFIVFGITAVLSNCVVLVVIRKTKLLQTKCFYLLSANAVSDIILGAGYATTGIKRLYRYYTGIGELINMWTCCWEMSLCTFAQSLSLSMAAALIIDRLLSITYPQKYKIWSYRRSVVPLCIGAWIYAIIQFSVHIGDSWRGRSIILITCSTEYTVFSETLDVLTSLQIVFSVLVVLSNCILSLKARRKRKKQQAANYGNSIGNQLVNAIRNEKEMKIIRTITIIIVLHVLSHTVGRLVILIVKALFDEIVQSATNRYMRELVVLNATIHLFVLLATSSLFRKAAKNQFTSSKVGTESGGVVTK